AEAFGSLPAHTPVNSIGGVYDELMASRPGAICGSVLDASFSDVGTVSDYWTTSEALMRAEALGDTIQGTGVRLDRSAHVTRSILWDNVSVGAGATLDECIVTDGVRVPPGSTYRRCAIVGRPATDELLVSPF
ncbi:MAG: hypothetical protein WBD07_06255, partial [Vicinamibacterales bacterium]